MTLRLSAGHRPNAPRPRGVTSLALKGFLLVGTVGLLGWAGFLPDNDDDPPLGFVLLFLALVVATLCLLVLRVLGRTRPLIVPIIHGVARIHTGRPLSPSAEATLDTVESVLSLVQVVAWVVFGLGLIVVIAMAVAWHATIPLGLGVAPLCVAIGAQIGLWLIGRAEFPGGGI